MNIKHLRIAFVFAIAIFMNNIAGAAETETDVRTENTIRHSYIFKTYLKDNDVEVVAKDGIVTLQGTVEDDNERSLAQNVSESVPGVIRVNNQLKLKDELPAPDSDAWIGLKVKAALLVHRNVSGIQTRVEVQEGVVTLEGEASSEAQKELTSEYTKDIQGVTKVINKITVVKSPQAEQDKKDLAAEEIDDASIAAQVKWALFSHRSTSAIKTSVETRDGVVTLNGKAKNEAEKALVSKLVNDIKGVKGVDNKMDVI